MLLHLSKLLHERPPQPELPGYRVRTFTGFDDIAAWLAVRNAAYAGQIAGTRPWTERDFRREFLVKSWWRPDWMWLVECGVRNAECGREELRAIPGDQRFAGAGHETPNCGTVVGVVGLGLSERRDNQVASVQWLAVTPNFRQRGIGRILMATLEAAAWDAGHREVHAETLAAWEIATRFYQALGYRPIAGA